MGEINKDMIEVNQLRNNGAPLEWHSEISATIVYNF